MTTTDRGQATVIPVGDCRCPGSPHALDTVTLRPEISLALGVASVSVLRQGGSQATVEAHLVEVFLEFGIASWTLTDEVGGAIPVNPDTIAAHLPYLRGGREVAEAASELYDLNAIVAPFLATTPSSSPTGQTDGSTSANPDTGEPTPMASRRSSPRSTAGTPSVAPV